MEALHKKEDYQSSYYYEGTNVLKNKLDIKNKENLEIIDKIISVDRISKLKENPIKGKFDVNHLMKIHKFIFGDIYPFAGKFRNEEIDLGGGFAPIKHLGEATHEVLNSLNKERYLKGLDVDKTSEKLAYYMSELNFAHPFMEGNGKAQREFIRTLAIKNGYKLDWDKVDSDKLLDATITATREYDTDKLSQLIKDCIVNKEPDRNISKILNKEIEYER
ncbi:Fic/DOC family protein [Clostridium sp. UBA6640]|uniref:Fic/DOC family protein n=1 Tax=Clostridium sp. UBA6640 TaxID=1946370 RepID=UPI0025C1BA84|nr:Fic family protein [Clostridium sp. UBA6640]